MPEWDWTTDLQITCPLLYLWATDLYQPLKFLAYLIIILCIMVLMRWVRGLFSIVAWSTSVLQSPSLFATHPISVLSVSQKVKKKQKFENLSDGLMNIIDGFNEQILIIAIWLCQYNTFRLLIIKLLIYNMNLLRTKFDYLSWTISMTIYMGRGGESSVTNFG